MPERSTSRCRFSCMNACTSRMRRCRCGLGSSAPAGSGPSMAKDPSLALSPQTTPVASARLAVPCRAPERRLPRSDHVFGSHPAVVLLGREGAHLDGDLFQGAPLVVGPLRDGG